MNTAVRMQVKIGHTYFICEIELGSNLITFDNKKVHCIIWISLSIPVPGHLTMSYFNHLLGTSPKGCLRLVNLVFI